MFVLMHLVAPISSLASVLLLLLLAFSFLDDWVSPHLVCFRALDYVVGLIVLLDFADMFVLRCSSFSSFLSLCAV